MSKLIIGNYISGITCFSFGNLLYQGISLLKNSPDSIFIGLKYSQYASFLTAGQLTFILILYFLLTCLIYKYGKFEVIYDIRPSTEKIYFILLIPITVLSFIIGPYIALKANGITILPFIEKSISGTFVFLQGFIQNISLYMFLNGIIFILLASHINLKISLSSKSTKIPTGIE